MLSSITGFTLVELVLSIALGMLLITIVVTIFIAAQQMLGAQQQSAELQQNANIGLMMLVRDIRHSNLNTLSLGQVNNKVNGSGIVFTQENLPPTLRQDITAITTQQEVTATGVLEKSDQLLIQYQPIEQTVTSSSGSLVRASTKPGQWIIDCEGQQIELTDQTTAGPVTVVNRYYVAKDPQTADAEPESYSLYCESGWYRPGDQAITGLNGGGQQLIKRVEAFKLRLVVQAPNGQLSYMGIRQYKQLMVDQVTDPSRFYNVVAVEVGVLIRAMAPIPVNRTEIRPELHYMLAGQQMTIAQSPKPQQRYQRMAMSQVVALRNVQGVTVYE